MIKKQTKIEWTNYVFLNCFIEKGKVCVLPIMHCQRSSPPPQLPARPSLVRKSIDNDDDVVTRFCQQIKKCLRQNKWTTHRGGKYYRPRCHLVNRSFYYLSSSPQGPKASPRRRRHQFFSPSTTTTTTTECNSSSQDWKLRP